MLIALDYLPTDRIKGIMHIGAHHAEELTAYIAHGIHSVIWIEANPDNIPVINRKISKYKGMSSYCFAASRESSLPLSLNIANNGQSSSILELGTHQTHHPNVHYVKSVPCVSLSIDDFVNLNAIDMRHFNMLNLDVQGYELEVLHGALRCLHHIDFVYTEVNSEAVYQGAPLFQDIEEFLQNNGFTLVTKTYTEYGWGDAFFAKKNTNRLRFALARKKIFSKAKSLFSTKSGSCII